MIQVYYGSEPYICKLLSVFPQFNRAQCFSISDLFPFVSFHRKPFARNFKPEARLSPRIFLLLLGENDYFFSARSQSF